jgi:hypothetical protein
VALRRRLQRPFTPVSAPWANPIEAQLGPVRTFVMGGSDHRNHTVPARKLEAHLRWRNANARHPDVLVAQRREQSPRLQRASAMLGPPKTKIASRTTSPVERIWSPH